MQHAHHVVNEIDIADMDDTTTLAAEDLEHTREDMGVIGSF